MSRIIELRLTQTEFEELFTSYFIGSLINDTGGPVKQVKKKVHQLLLAQARLNELKQLVAQEGGPLELNEKVIKKMERCLNEYNYLIADRLHEEIEQRVKKDLRKGKEKK